MIYKPIPVSVYLDATELQHRLVVLRYPTHPTLVAALADHILDRSFYSSAADFEILIDKLGVVHHLHALIQVTNELAQALATVLRARTCLGDQRQMFAELFDDLADMTL